MPGVTIWSQWRWTRPSLGYPGVRLHDSAAEIGGSLALPWGKLHRLGALALLVLSAVFLTFRCSTSPEIPFVSQRADAPWVMPPFPVTADLHQWGRESVPVTSFRRTVRVESAPAPGVAVTLRLRAFRGYTATLNGESVPGGSDDGADWRSERSFDLTRQLRPGFNELRIDVANAHGPALLALRIEGLAEPVVSDSSWGVWHDGRLLGAAIPADDTRRNPVAVVVATPIEALVERRDVLLGAFTLGVVAFLIAGRAVARRRLALLPDIALAAAGVAWLVLFFHKFLELPIEVGFDARHHKLYVDLLRANLAVPVATDGWSVYHPPLFYAMAAGFQWLGEALGGSRGGVIGLKLLPFLAGLANVWIAAQLCRRLFPEDLGKGLATAVFAAVLPMNLYISAYFSNETFHTLLAGLAVLLTVDLLLMPSMTRRRMLALGSLVGLALLTKYTAVIVGSVALFFLICKLFAVERAAPARVATAVGLFVAPPLVLAGWFYLRNVLLFGDPLIANWGDMPGPTLKWWQQPGFHTAAFYLHFGESFSYPYLSAFTSFWDSLYSTLWGDGGIAGRVNPTQRHVFWNYQFMSAAYLLAVPATLFAGAGALRCTYRALRDDDPRRRAAFSFIMTLSYAILFGLLYLSLRLPYFGQAKATYGLVVMPALSVFFADGLAWLDETLSRRGWHFARALVVGWFTAFVVTCYLAFAA